MRWEGWMYSRSSSRKGCGPMAVAPDHCKASSLYFEWEGGHCRFWSTEVAELTTSFKDSLRWLWEQEIAWGQRRKPGEEEWGVSCNNPGERWQQFDQNCSKTSSERRLECGHILDVGLQHLLLDLWLGGKRKGNQGGDFRMFCLNYVKNEITIY